MVPHNCSYTFSHLMITGPPPPVVASMEHSPLTTPFTISCLTHDSPPMKIIWKKDEEVINFTNNSIDYQLTQTLVNRTSSTYNNTLTINGTIEDVIGEYSCAVANRLGTSNTLSKSVKGAYFLDIMCVVMLAGYRAKCYDYATYTIYST